MYIVFGDVVPTRHDNNNDYSYVDMEGIIRLEISHTRTDLTAHMQSPEGGCYPREMPRSNFDQMP